MFADKYSRQAIDALSRYVEVTLRWQKEFMVELRKAEKKICDLEEDNADLRRRIGLPARKDSNADH